MTPRSIIMSTRITGGRDPPPVHNAKYVRREVFYGDITTMNIAMPRLDAGSKG